MPYFLLTHIINSEPSTPAEPALLSDIMADKVLLEAEYAARRERLQASKSAQKTVVDVAAQHAGVQAGQLSQAGAAGQDAPVQPNVWV